MNHKIWIQSRNVKRLYWPKPEALVHGYCSTTYLFYHVWKAASLRLFCLQDIYSHICSCQWGHPKNAICNGSAFCTRTRLVSFNSINFPLEGTIFFQVLQSMKLCDIQYLCMTKNVRNTFRQEREFSWKWNDEEKSMVALKSDRKNTTLK